MVSILLVLRAGEGTLLSVNLTEPVALQVPSEYASQFRLLQTDALPLEGWEVG